MPENAPDAAPEAKAHRSEGSAEEPPRLNPDPAVCSLWLPKKRRFCRSQVHRGSRYCGAHLSCDPEYEAKPGERRVPCPLNPNHSVAEAQLAHHVTVCADRKIVAAHAPYYLAGCNGERSEAVRFEKGATAGTEAAAQGAASTGGSSEAAAAAELTRMDRRDAATAHYKRLQPAELEDLVALVEQAHAAHVAPFLCRRTDAGGSEYDVEGAEADADEPVGRAGTQYAGRQQPQLRALLDCMACIGAVPPPPHGKPSSARLESAGGGAVVAPLVGPAVTSFVEMAAGKGAFALAVADRWASWHAARAAQGAPEPPKQMIVVDRGGFRRKADGRVANAGAGAAAGEDGAADGALPCRKPFVRLRIDVRDLHLPAVPELQPAKHGTGDVGEVQAAVVFGKHLCGNCTDFALTAAVRAAADAAGPVPARVVLATCCHHLVERRNLCAVFARSAASADAEALTALAALLDGPLTGDRLDLVASLASWAVSAGHAPVEAGDAADAWKVRVGRKAKQLIDWARVLFLRAAGMRAELVDGFVAPGVSPENHLILAWRP